MRHLSQLADVFLHGRVGFYLFRARTHDQNIVPLIICNKIVTLLKINVPSCQINDPPSWITVPLCQINVPLSNKFPKFLRQNHDPRDIYLREGQIFVSLFDHVYGPSYICFILVFLEYPQLVYRNGWPGYLSHCRQITSNFDDGLFRKLMVIPI